MDNSNERLIEIRELQKINVDRQAQIATERHRSEQNTGVSKTNDKYSDEMDRLIQEWEQLQNTANLLVEAQSTK